MDQYYYFGIATHVPGCRADATARKVKIIVGCYQAAAEGAEW
jgi:hypothetical protein